MDFFFCKKRIGPLISKKIWKDEFGGDLRFSNGSTNSCGVLIAFHSMQDIADRKRTGQYS